MPIRTVNLRDAARCAHWARKGAEYLDLADRPRALEAYRTALEADPDDDTVRMALANLEAQSGEPGRAAELVLDAIRRRPAHPEAFNLLGVLLHQHGDRDEAARCWRRALALAPGFVTPRRNVKKGRAYGKGRAVTPLADPRSLAELLDERPVRLSVCLITRDEEELLPACLDSAAPVADEIIVVDTGSRDATPQIARSRGAQVVRHEWNDDFSAARNEALRHASGDWILFLDADERLVAESQAGLRTGIERGRFDYATVAIESVVGGETLITRALRLYRNYPGLQFLGRIHEQIVPALRDLEARFPLRRAEADIRLIHLGYDPALFAARGKEERNARLVDVELSERGDNAYVRLKAGEALFARGKFEAALEPIADGLAATWRAIDAGAAEALILEEPVTLHAACLVALSRPDEALATLAKAHGRLAPTANTLYLEGVGLWALGRAGAKGKLVAAMRAPDGRGELFTLPEVRGATPPFLLGSLALAEGDAAQARAWFEVALAREPDHREARLGLAEALFHAGSPAGAVQTLSGALALDPSDLRSWQAGAVYLVASPGQEASARAWLDAACALFPQDGVLDRLATDLRARG